MIRLPCKRGRREHLHEISWQTSTGAATSLRLGCANPVLWIHFAHLQAVRAPSLTFDGDALTDRDLLDVGWNSMAVLSYHADAGNELAVALLADVTARWTKW